MSLLQETQIQTSVYICSFECFIRKANIAMKFPCSYFVEWRTVNSKISVKTQRHNPNQDTVNFDQKINLTVQMLFDHNKVQFLNRDTIVQLFLISRSRPDQHKLVGRVNIDLGKVINVGMYEEPTEFNLNFCSIKGNLIMQFKACQQKLTTLTINDLDKSSFIDFMAQKALKNQSMVHSRYENQGLEAKSIEKPVRSQIRGVSPSSPKLNIKQSLFVKTNSSKIEVNKRQTSLVQQQITNKQSKISNKSNDQLQAKSKIGFRNNRFNRLKTQQNDQQQPKIGQIPETTLISQENKKTSILSLQIQNFEKAMMQNMNKRSAVSSNSENITLINNNLLPVRTIKDQIIKFKNAVSFQEKDQILTDLNEENRKTKEQFINVLNQNAELHNVINDRQKVILELSNKLKGQSKKYQDLLGEITKKHKIIQQFDKQLTNKQLTISNLQFQFSKTKTISAENEALKKRLLTLQTFNQDLKQQINQYQQKSTSYTAKIAKYQSQIKSLQKDHQKCLKKISQYIQQQIQMKKKIEDLQIENNQLIRHFEQTNKQMDTLRNNKNLPQLQQEIQAMHDSIEKGKMRLQKAERQASQIQTKYFQLESKYELLQASHKVLKEKKGQNNQNNQENSEIIEEIIVDSFKEIKFQGENQNVHQQNLQKQNQCLSSQIQFLKKNCENIQNQNFSLQKQNQFLKQQIVSLQSKLSEFEQFKNQLLQTKAENQNLIEYNNNIEKQISQIQHQWEYQSTKYQQQIKKLKLENDQLRQQIKTQIQLYQQQLTFLKNQISRIKQNRQVKPPNVLQQKCIEYKQMIDKLNSNLQQQINQNNQLSQAIVRYMQKQAKMKQTLSVLQRQSTQIFSLVHQKELNEQTYQKAIDQLHIQILQLKEQQQSQRITQINKQELQQKMQIHVNQSHNEELLKLQEKLLQQNNQLAMTCNNLKEENAKLNEELMLTCIQNNEVNSTTRAQISQLKDQLTKLQTQIANKEENYLTKIKDLQRNIKNKDIEVEIWKSRNSDKQLQQQKYQMQISKLISDLEQSQEDKFNLQSSNHQKDIHILQLTQQVNALILINSTTPKPQSNEQLSLINENLNLINDLKEKLLNKNWNSDWDSLLQSVLDKSVMGEQTSKLLNLQQKSRLLSKQLQKMKASLLKSEWRNQQQKLATMGLFKKCDIIVVELINCAQSLNQNQSSFL